MAHQDVPAQDKTHDTAFLSEADAQRLQFEQNALHYHEHPRPGKISVTPTKQIANQRDLALAYLSLIHI